MLTGFGGFRTSGLIRCVSYMNAEKYNLERIYFGGCFIRGGYKRCIRRLIPAADVGSQDTQRPSARCLMLYGFGARARNGRCFCVTRGSCMCRVYYCPDSEVATEDFLPARGAIGAWIKNITPAEA